MKTVQIFTDSTSDVVKKFREENELDYVRMVFTFAGKNYDADLDWADISPAEFYGMMRQGQRAITGQVQSQEIETKFESALEKGLDVLYIACSSKLSQSVNMAKTFSEDLAKKYPDRKIVCYDSLRSNYAEGLMAINAAKMALDGKSIDEIVKCLDETKLKYQTFATVGSLEWLKKAGRVKAGAAFFGNLFSVKPIIVGDKIGNNYAFKKVKGRKTSLDELVNIIAERVENPEQSYLFIENADCEKDAEYVKAEISKKVNFKEIFISSIGPIVGSTVGPDSITVNFYGKEVEIAGEE